MKKARRSWSGDNRFRVMLTLGLAVVLPAAALIGLNFQHLKSIERDKVLEAAIHRDFQQMLAISEKKMNKKALSMTNEVREMFPCPTQNVDVASRLDAILAAHPWVAHAFLYDQDKGFVMRSQPDRMKDKYFWADHERLAEMMGGWMKLEGKSLLHSIRKNESHTYFFSDQVKRAGGYVYQPTALFTIPEAPSDRVAVGGISFDGEYLQYSFFPEMLDDLMSNKFADEGGNRLAMVVFSGQPGDMMKEATPLAASSGWNNGTPEVSRKFDEVFKGLSLGIKFQGTTVEAIGQRFVKQSFLILGVLSLLLVAGLVFTYRSVSKEMALAKLKSDFVSNVSHELRTPLSLIRLYAETLELGRIRSDEKEQEYYRIIRKESERLTALINNILDFSRIEAGRKEYEFRETDLSELVRNTLEAYRYQIEQQGFTFEQNISDGLPPVRVDREAIARSLVNLVNNALKYSGDRKFLGVNLERTNGAVKLEVIDHGIGIARSEQAKIFEKFYRAGDPLVHTTKGSGLGLSLVRHIARAHGGDIEVDSAPGKGSRFTLRLPLETAPEAAKAASSGAVAS